jgi:glutathione S-transferase
MSVSLLPILYSFRRCPYAMRARMAIAYAGIAVELREVVLRDKPPSLLTYSPKGEVPVLVLPGGTVIDESRDIMLWALGQQDAEGWLPADKKEREVMESLMDENDGKFKIWLDHYKYADRFPEHSAEHYRAQGEVFLAKLESRLAGTAYLFGDSCRIGDVAIFPFVRQFAFADKAWFDDAPYPRLQQWLEGFLASALFGRIMSKYMQWHEGDAVTVFPQAG